MIDMLVGDIYGGSDYSKVLIPYLISAYLARVTRDPIEIA